MRDGLKAAGTLVLVTIMLAATVLAAAAPRRSYHGAQLLGISGECVTILSGGEMHALCGVAR